MIFSLLMLFLKKKMSKTANFLNKWKLKTKKKKKWAVEVSVS